MLDMTGSGGVIVPGRPIGGGAAATSAAVTRIGVARRLAFIGGDPEDGVLPGTVGGSRVAIADARSEKPRPL
jgi:hypothetical protein